jgi:hypothetical protein
MRARYSDVVLDAFGNVVPLASVAVYDPDTTDLIVETIYADATGVDTLANPFLTDDLGRFEFYLEDPKRVDLYASKFGSVSYTLENVDVITADIPADIMRDAEHTAIGDGAPHHAAATAVDSAHTIPAGQVVTAVAATAAQIGHATAAQITKLDGIEAAADVTDATNVEAAGAVMEADANWIDLTDAGVTALHTHAGGGGGTKIVDADADTKVDVEEGADDDTVRIDVGGASAVADAIVITGAGGLVSKVSLIPDTDSVKDLGSSAPKYWANAYVDKIYLNSTATLDGATAGLINATGNLQLSGNLGVAGAAPLTTTGILLVTTVANTTMVAGCNIQPVVTAGIKSHLLTGISGSATLYGFNDATGTHTLHGLNFYCAACSNVGETVLFAIARGMAIQIKETCIGASTLTVTLGEGIYVVKPTITNPGTGGTYVLTTYYGIHIQNSTSAKITNNYGLYIEDSTLATSINRIIQAGPGDGYFVVKGSSEWAKTDYQTPIWIGADDPTTLQQVTVGAADSGGAGYRCLRIPNL